MNRTAPHKQPPVIGKNCSVISSSPLIGPRSAPRPRPYVREEFRHRTSPTQVDSLRRSGRQVAANDVGHQTNQSIALRPRGNPSIRFGDSAGKARYHKFCKPPLHDRRGLVDIRSVAGPWHFFFLKLNAGKKRSPCVLLTHMTMASRHTNATGLVNFVPHGATKTATSVTGHAYGAIPCSP